MAYEHLGLHPVAEPIPVGPGGRLVACSAGAPVPDDVAFVEPEAELTPEVADSVGFDRVSEEAADCAVATLPEEAVVVVAADLRL